MPEQTPLAVVDGLALTRSRPPAPRTSDELLVELPVGEPLEGHRPAARHSAPAAPGRRGYRLRGRHVRELRVVRMGSSVAVPDVPESDDRLVLQVLRQVPLGDLDAAQVSARAALPPSVVAMALDRLVRGGLARETVHDGRVRFGLA
jgi:hypothetical protein